jgi:predicted lipoprotein with Yx(FWY)xxD motif
MHVESRLLIAAALLCLALAACGGDEITGDDLAADGGDETAEAEDTGDDAAGDVAVASATVALGEILVDGDGMSLYLFEPDEQGASTCYDDCEANWPPLVTDGEPTAGDGADPDLLGTAERDDGTSQVTYDGWPLYHWIGDETEGDVNGQGIQEVWWVLDPAGTPIRGDDAEADAEDDAETTGSGARSGY